MGDRSNIFIQTNKKGDGTWDGVGVYAHWAGERLHETALRVLPLANGRIGDEAYFARIVIHNLLVELADPAMETGFGIWVDGPCDNEGYLILVINAQTGRHWFTPIDNFRVDESLVSNLTR